MYLVNDTSTYVYDDVAPWHDACIASGNDCHRFPGWTVSMDGNLTYVGHPYASPGYSDHLGWLFHLLNRKVDGHGTIEGNKQVIYYGCQDWIGAYRSKNVSDFLGRVFLESSHAVSK